jgi:hypothetical protein
MINDDDFGERSMAANPLGRRVDQLRLASGECTDAFYASAAHNGHPIRRPGPSSANASLSSSKSSTNRVSEIRTRSILLSAG